MLSNIDKVQKMINPKSKKQIVQLDEDSYFNDLIESIKTYLIEKKNFPSSVYNAAYGLVEFATNQFEENTKQIEELIRQRETNINAGSTLKELLQATTEKEKTWKDSVKEAENDFDADIIETLGIIGRSRSDKSQNYQDALKLINARIANLDSNLHIEIDMERIEDRSKALSYIGIEVADALKAIPTPVEEAKTVVKEALVEEQPKVAVAEPVMERVTVTEYAPETFEVKPSLWQRMKNSKIARAIKYVFSIRVVLDMPALPEGRGEDY